MFTIRGTRFTDEPVKNNDIKMMAYHYTGELKQITLKAATDALFKTTKMGTAAFDDLAESISTAKKRGIL